MLRLGVVLNFRTLLGIRSVSKEDTPLGVS
jgi:hypothetical protein